MDRFVRKIQAIMTDDDQHPLFSLASFLALLAGAYGGAMKLRGAAYDRPGWPRRQLPCKVISVGNLTVGGTGKTPMTLLVAERLHHMGSRPVVLSRGYKGRGERSGGVVGDGRRILMDPAAAGDEPFLLASSLGNIPVIIGRDRFAAGLRAVREFNADVVVLDDGFQHLRLWRDIDLVLLDYRRPLGNRRLLPRGTLREPVSALKRAHAFVLTRSDVSPDAETVAALGQLRRHVNHKPVFRAVHAAEIKQVVLRHQASSAYTLGRPLPPGLQNELKKRRVFAFSGLADNTRFQHSVELLGAVPAGTMAFGDHHPYSKEDIRTLSAAARKAGADCMATSEKDFVRLAGQGLFPLDLVVIGVNLAFEPDDKAFCAFLAQRLELG